MSLRAKRSEAIFLTMPAEKIYTFQHAKQYLIEQIKALDVSTKPHSFRLEIRIKPIDQINWLEAQSQPIKIFGANTANTLAIAGIGASLSLSHQQMTSFDSVINEMRKHLSMKHPYMQWYGGFAFDCHLSSEWNGFDAYRFILPQVELARNGKKMMLACNLVGDINKKKLIKFIITIKLPTAATKQQLPSISKRIDSPTQRQWIKNVDDVLQLIALKKVKKVVLARRTQLSFKDVINPWIIFRRLMKVTPSSYHFVFQFGSTTFLGASPERLFQRMGDNLASQALAGTKSRQCKVQDLFNSVKDQHEHRLVVDAINKALTPLANDIKFPDQPTVVTLTNGHHLNTPFVVTLKKNKSDGHILTALHPTPALGGYPRQEALTIIKKLEPFKRGWYAGPVGYVGLDWAEFVVAIRSGLVKENKLSLYAGAGIVDGSKPVEEWDEVENKISNFQKIITQ